MLSFTTTLSVLFSIVQIAHAEDPYRETANALLPTSTESEVKYQFTNGTSGNWFDVPDGQRSITFTKGMAGWRIANDPETEVIYTATNMYLYPHYLDMC
jgi:hypothetical protein